MIGGDGFILRFYMGFLSWLTGDNHKRTTEHHRHGEVRSWEGSGFTWYDVHQPTAHGLAKLAESVGIEQGHLSAAIQKNQLSVLEHYEECCYLSVHFPVMNGMVDQVVALETVIVFNKDFLITIHNQDHREVVDALFDQCFKGELDGPALKSTVRLLQMIVEELQRESNNLIIGIFNELDEIEDRVFDTSGSEAKMIGQLRRKIVRMRFILGAQRLVLDDLPGEVSLWGGDKQGAPFKLIAKTNKRMSEALDEAQQTIEIYKDADYTISSDRTNTIMAVLTLMFTLTIPITLVAGIYGMNVNLPGGLESRPWDFWGPYTTLAVTVGLSVAVAVVMFVYFRIKKWF